jgi:hypothetical protein
VAAFLQIADIIDFNAEHNRQFISADDACKIRWCESDLHKIWMPTDEPVYLSKLKVNFQMKNLSIFCLP